MLLMIFISCFPALSIEVSGTLSGVTLFKVEENPIIFTGDTVIAEGATVTFQAGTLVKFRKVNQAGDTPTPAVDIVIRGTINVEGTKDFPVRFTSEEASPASGDWGTIVFEDKASDASLIQWATFEYGDVQVKCEASNPRFEYCTFRYAKTGSVELFDSNALFLWCTFKDNKNPPSPLTDPYGLTTDGTVAFSPMIKGCLFEGNKIGLMVRGSNKATVFHNQFQSNVTAMKVDGGLALPEIKGNNFISNTTVVEAINSANVNATFNYWSGNTANSSGTGTVTASYPLAYRIDRTFKVTAIAFKDSAYSNDITTSSVDSTIYTQINGTGDDTTNRNACVVKLTTTTTDTTGIYLPLTETAANTNIFRSSTASIRDASTQASFRIGAVNAETLTVTSMTDPTRKYSLTVGQATPPPPVTITQPQPDDIGETSLILKWSRYNGGSFASYKIYMSKTANVTIDNYLKATVTDVNTVQTTLNSLSPGMTYYVKIFVFTTAGTSSGSNEITFTTDPASGDDKTPPGAPVITEPAQAAITVNTTPYKIKGTCDPADTNQILVNMSTTGVTYTSGQPAWEASVSLKEGVNVIDVTARDTALNESAPDTITITLDTMPPKIPVITDPNSGNNYITGTKNITLKGTVSTDTQLVFVNGSTLEVSYTAGATTFSRNMVLSEGINTIYVTARDAAKNESLPATIVITLDSQPPTDPKFTSPNQGRDFITSKSPITLSGVCDPSSSAIYVNGTGAGVTYTPGVGTFIFQTQLTEGLNTFTLTARDQIGNDSAPSVINIFYYSQVPRKWFDARKLSTHLADETRPFAIGYDNDLHVAWHEMRDGNEEIIYTRALDTSTTWDAEQRLTTATGKSTDPCLAASSGMVFITWTDNRDGNDEIYFKSSLDNGANWARDIRVTSNSARSYTPSMCVNAQTIHLVWVDGRTGDHELFYTASTDLGATWRTPIQVTGTAGNSSTPRLVSHGNILYLLWADDRFGYPQLYTRRSEDQGFNWSPEVRVTSVNAVSQTPDIVVDDNGVHVVWADNRTSGDMEIYYMRSPDRGDTWGGEQRITSSTGVSAIPRIAADGISLYVVWQDNASGSNEIMFARSGNVGDTWQTPEAVTATGKNSKNPCVTRNTMGAHIFWWDTTDDTNDEFGKIYTRDWATFAPPVVVNELQFTDTAQVEIWNRGLYSVQMEGWTFTTGGLVYTFPDYFLSPESSAVLHEGAGANDDDDLYTNLAIPWTLTSGGSCSLADATAAPFDFVRWGGDTTSPPGGTNWAGENPANPAAGKNLGRDFSSTDTDFGRDWTAQTPSLHAANYDTGNNAKLALTEAKSSVSAWPGFWETKLIDGSKVHNNEFAVKNSGAQVIITLDIGAETIINRMVICNDGQYGAKGVTVEFVSERNPDLWLPLLIDDSLDVTADQVNTDTFTFEDVTARKVRAIFTSFNDPAWFQMAEIELWGRSVSGASINLPMQSASSTPTAWPGYGPETLTDTLMEYNGDFAVKNSGAPVAIVMDLGSNSLVEKITHYNDGAYGSPSVVIRYALDGSPDTWNTAGNFTGLNLTASTANRNDLLMTAAFTGRYIKLEYNEFGSSGWFQLNEIQVWGKAGASAETLLTVADITSSVVPFPGYGTDKLKNGLKVYNSEFAAKNSSAQVQITLDLSDDATISKIVHYNDGAYGAKSTVVEYATNTAATTWNSIGTFASLSLNAGQVNRNEFNFNSVTGRYIRFTYNDFGEATWFQLSEIEVFGTGGSAPALVKRPITAGASSVVPYVGYGVDQLYDGARVFNGDFAVRNSGGQVLLELDMGSDQKFAKILHVNDGQFGANSVQVEYSTAAAPSVWKAIGTYSGLRLTANQPNQDTFTFTEVTGRKIRLIYTQYADPTYFQLNEIEVWGANSAAPLLPLFMSSAGQSGSEAFLTAIKTNAEASAEILCMGTAASGSVASHKKTVQSWQNGQTGVSAEDQGNSDPENASSQFTLPENFRIIFIGYDQLPVSPSSELKVTLFNLETVKNLNDLREIAKSNIIILSEGFHHFPSGLNLYGLMETLVSNGRIIVLDRENTVQAASFEKMGKGFLISRKLSFPKISDETDYPAETLAVTILAPLEKSMEMQSLNELWNEKAFAGSANPVQSSEFWNRVSWITMVPAAFETTALQGILPTISDGTINRLIQYEGLNPDQRLELACELANLAFKMGEAAEDSERKINAQNGVMNTNLKSWIPENAIELLNQAVEILIVEPAGRY
jgi:hypothetical protein